MPPPFDRTHQKSESEPAREDSPKKHRFLMCAPRYYDVGYVINPWMSANVHRVSQTLARDQWTALHQLIQASADVQLVDGQPDLPDMVFTANAGLVVGDQVILSAFRHPERKPEEAHFERWFNDHGLAVRKLPAKAFFEGAGDALLDRERDCIWMGFGYRTTRDVGAYLQELLSIEVITLELTDPRFYHLDTCLCPLPRGNILYYPNAFSEASLALLKRKIPPEKAIAVSEDDAKRFCCNAVSIGDQILLNDASQPLAVALSRAGFQVQMSPLSEFLKSGGSAKCLTLRLEDPL